MTPELRHEIAAIRTTRSAWLLAAASTIGAGIAAWRQAATASGSAAVVGGPTATVSGTAATASGSAAIVSGTAATASGSATVVSGPAAIASGHAAVASSQAAIASGQAAVTGGHAATVSGSAAHAAAGSGVSGGAVSRGTGSALAALTGGQMTGYVALPALAAALAATILLVRRYHGPTAAVTFTLMPRRWRVFAASLLVVTGYALTVALLGAAVAWSVWRITDSADAAPGQGALLGVFVWFTGLVVAAAWSSLAVATVFRRVPAALGVLAAILAGESLLTRHVIDRAWGLPLPAGLRHAAASLAGDVARPLGIAPTVLAPAAMSALVMLLGGACLLVAGGALAVRWRDI